MEHENEFIQASRAGRHALAIAALSLATSAAFAQQLARSDDLANSGSNTNLMETWAKLRGELIEANELLSADVNNTFNPVGQVTDLVLSPDHRQVQYILYETPFPYSFFGAEDGFARYDAIELEHGAGFDTTLRLEPADSARPPEQLTITRDEARDRLVSRVIGSDMQFVDATREIDDLLIDRDTGAIVHYVVDTDPDALFGGETRTVPAARVTIADNGRISAALPLRELDSMQSYDPALL